MLKQTHYDISVAMKLLGIGLIGYGFLKARLYRKSASETGRRLGVFIAVSYVFIGLCLVFLTPWT